MNWVNGVAAFFKGTHSFVAELAAVGGSADYRNGNHKTKRLLRVARKTGITTV
jgi:hypothetical protein